jgi:hypothetical protein
MAFPSYIVAADFHTRPDAIEAMKQVVEKLLIEPAKEWHFYRL